MGERTNGYITIVAGLPEAIGARVDDQAPPGRKREIAGRLRKHGWSYRRIADALSVPYSTISFWMDDEPVRTSVPLAPLVLTGARGRLATAGRSRLSIDERAAQMEARERPGVAQRELATAMEAMERRLLAALHKELKAWGQRLLEAIKAIKAGGGAD